MPEKYHAALRYVAEDPGPRYFSVPDSRGGLRNYRLKGLVVRVRSGEVFLVHGAFRPAAGVMGQVPNRYAVLAEEAHPEWGGLRMPDVVDLKDVGPPWPLSALLDPTVPFQVMGNPVGVDWEQSDLADLGMDTYVRIRMTTGLSNGLYASDLSVADTPAGRKVLPKDFDLPAGCVHAVIRAASAWLVPLDYRV